MIHTDKWNCDAKGKREARTAEAEKKSRTIGSPEKQNKLTIDSSHLFFCGGCNCEHTWGTQPKSNFFDLPFQTRLRCEILESDARFTPNTARGESAGKLSQFSFPFWFDRQRKKQNFYRCVFLAWIPFSIFVRKFAPWNSFRISYKRNE